jgi:hypothetical protein
MLLSQALWFSGKCVKGGMYCHGEGAVCCMFRLSVKISWQTPQLIPAVSVSSWIVWRQSSLMSSQFFQRFLSFCWCLVTLNVRRFAGAWSL